MRSVPKAEASETTSTTKTSLRWRRSPRSPIWKRKRRNPARRSNSKTRKRSTTEADIELEEEVLESSGLTPAELKAVQITSTFETGKRGGFYGLSGNFDGYGISFGLVNWKIGTGSLQPLLRDFAAGEPARWKAGLRAGCLVLPGADHAEGQGRGERPAALRHRGDEHLAHRQGQEQVVGQGAVVHVLQAPLRGPGLPAHPGAVRSQAAGPRAILLRVLRSEERDVVRVHVRRRLQPRPVVADEEVEERRPEAARTPAPARWPRSRRSTARAAFPKGSCSSRSPTCSPRRRASVGVTT